MKTYFISRDDTYEIYTKEAIPEDLKKELEKSIDVKCYHQHLDNVLDFDSPHLILHNEDETGLYFEGYKHFFQISKWDRNDIRRTDELEEFDLYLVEKILERYGYTKDDRRLDSFEIPEEILTKASHNLKKYEEQYE